MSSRTRIVWLVTVGVIISSLVWYMSIVQTTSKPVEIERGFQRAEKGTVVLSSPRKGSGQADAVIESPPRWNNLTHRLLSKDHSVVTAVMHFKPLPSEVHQLFCTFLRSAAVFWPRRFGGPTLILDEESPSDHRFAADLEARESALGVDITFKFQPLPDDRSLLEVPKSKGPGYMRQIWNQYWVDLYVDTPVVAFFDADIMLISPLTPEVMFSGGRLKVHGTSIETAKGYLHLYNHTTYTMIGKQNVGFFGYFPTFLWTDTYTNCRRHILNHLNTTSFEKAYRMGFVPKHYNPLNTLLNYAFYYEHDRYEWHFQLFGMPVAEYNRRYLEPSVNLTPAEALPDLCVIKHKPRYWKSRLGPRSPFEQGYCDALKHVGNSNSGCDRLDLGKQVHYFDMLDAYNIRKGAWCYGKELPDYCRDLMATHHQTYTRYHGMGLYDFDLSGVRAVEKVAAEMNVTCENLMWQGEGP